MQQGLEKRSTAAGMTALAVAGSIWGTGFIFGKWAFEDLSVAHMVLMRFVFASLAFLPVLWREMRRPRQAMQIRDWWLILTASLLGIPVQFLVQFEGLSRTTVSHASLMVGALPVLIAVGAAIFSHERLGRLGWCGLIASTLGAVLVALGGGGSASVSPTVSGDLLVVASLFASVAWVLLSQALMKRNHSPALVGAAVTVYGTVMLAVWVLATKGPPPISAMSPKTWMSVFAVGVFATTLTTLLWNWGLMRVPASKAGVFINLEPLIGTILGFVLFGERMGMLGIFGGLLIIGAAILVARTGTNAD